MYQAHFVQISRSTIFVQLFQNHFLISNNIKILQSETSSRWKYTAAHAICVLDIKRYKHFIRIFETLWFSTAKTVTWTHLNVTFYVLCVDCVVLIENWTKTPLSAAHVNRWSNSLRTTRCSGESDYNLWIS